LNTCIRKHLDWLPIIFSYEAYMKRVTLLSVTLKVFYSTFTKLIETNVIPQGLKLSSYWDSVYGLRVHCAWAKGGQRPMDAPVVELHKSIALKLRIVITNLHTTDTLAGLLTGPTKALL
jgi:hypothetical protein